MCSLEKRLYKYQSSGLITIDLYVLILQESASCRHVPFLHVHTYLTEYIALYTILLLSWYHWSSCTLKWLHGFSSRSDPLKICIEFGKIKLENSSSTDWLFSLQKSILKLIFAAYTGSKNPVWNRLKIQFVESNLIFLNWFFRNQVQTNKGRGCSNRFAITMSKSIRAFAHPLWLKYYVS